MPAYCLFFFLSVSCTEHRNKNATNRINSRTPGRHSIAIVPFTGIDTGLVNEIREGLRKKLTADITISGKEDLPLSAFYVSRKRYIADSLLYFLRGSNRNKSEKVIGITAVDISTRKKPYINWGVMGLGETPGVACVISSYRVMKSVQDRQRQVKRMIILSLHELGHTYGLDHCADALCIMRDAKGKTDLDRTLTFCPSCGNFLRNKGVLK